MKEFSVTVLGSSAAIATEGRNLTSHLVNHSNNLYLIDCGEGTQFRLQHLKVKTNRIKNIFISHLHGDHFFGLVGLISTMHLLHRTEPLHVYGPPLLKDIIELQLESTATVVGYPLTFHSTQDDHEEVIYDDGRLTISSFPLTHRVPTTGFLFREKEQPFHINKEAIEAAIKVNINPKTIHKRIIYKCTQCGFWHIGRNSTVLTDADKDKIKRKHLIK